MNKREQRRMFNEYSRWMYYILPKDVYSNFTDPFYYALDRYADKWVRAEIIDDMNQAAHSEYEYDFEDFC